MSAALLGVLLEARARLADASNDYAWSSWDGSEHALAEMDLLIAAVRRGELPALALQVVFAPTGPMQEVSLSSGWGQEFLALAARFDAALGDRTA